MTFNTDETYSTCLAKSALGRSLGVEDRWKPVFRFLLSKMARTKRKRKLNQFLEGQDEQHEWPNNAQHSYNGFYDNASNGAIQYGITARPHEAPEGVYHYTYIDEVPSEIRSYFHQRNRIFKLYNHGIWMTDKAWYGVTQEAVADKIAAHVAASRTPERVVALDVMAGAGGNTIAFAKSGHFQRIYGFEKDPATLECAQHNAEIYGVHDQITWFQGDCFDVLASQTGLQVLAKEYSVVFCSPPWGGPGYRNDKVFDLDTMEPYSIRKLYTELSKYSDHIVLYLPRTSDLRQIAELVEDGKKVNVIHYCTEGSSRALCVYLGPFNFGKL